MLAQLNVERLTFSFGDSWTYVTKWDDDPVYRTGIGNLQGLLDERQESTKAVDLVGIQDSALVLVEVKDFRLANDPITGLTPVALAHGGRWKSLPLEVALKVRDTLAGLAGCASRGVPTEMARAIGGTLEKPIRVVACVLQSSRPSEPDAKRKVRAKQMRDSLRSKLNWVTRDVVLVDPIDEPERLRDVRAANCGE